MAHRLRSAARQRAIGALLTVSLSVSGCAGVRVNEHASCSADSGAVSVRVVWDDGGVSRLVGGVHVALSRVGPDRTGAVAAQKTGPHLPLFFGELEPGRYRLVLSGEGMGTVDRTFDLRPGRRVSVRAEVEALEATRTVHAGHGDTSTSVGEGVLYVLKGVGLVLAVIAIVGIFLII